jgi:hypothetical protein
MNTRDDDLLLDGRGSSGSSSMATNDGEVDDDDDEYDDDDDDDDDEDEADADDILMDVDRSSIRTYGTSGSRGGGRGRGDEVLVRSNHGTTTPRERTDAAAAAAAVAAAAEIAARDFEDEIELGRQDAIRLVAALADDDAASKIRSVRISRSLQYALFYFSNGSTNGGGGGITTTTIPTQNPKRPSNGGSYGGSNGNVNVNVNGACETGEGDPNGGNGSHHQHDPVSSLSMLLAKVGTLPNLNELLIEGEDRITQFVSTGTLPAVFASIQPSMPNLQRIQIDAMLALPEHSIQALALCLSSAANLVDLTLSQLHFPSSKIPCIVNGGFVNRINESGRGSSDDNDDFLLPLVRSLASLGNLRRAHLGCVVDRPAKSALTLDCLRTLVRRPSSIQVLKLDSFKVTDSHLAALRDVFTCRRRKDGAAAAAAGSGSCGASPSALESLCLYRCENQQLTERGCRSILQLLESRHPCHIQHLFVSPRALQFSCKFTHPSNFQRQVRLLCLLNQIRIGHCQRPRPQPQQPSQPQSQEEQSQQQQQQSQQPQSQQQQSQQQQSQQPQSQQQQSHPQQQQSHPQQEVEEKEVVSSAAESAHTYLVRHSWIQLLATCTGDVNASYSIFIKNPELVRAVKTATGANSTKGGSGAPLPSHPQERQQQQPQQVPDQGSKRRRTGSVSSPV